MSNRPPCKFFQNGNCRFGNRCKFSHDQGGNRGGGGGFGNNRGGFNNRGQNNTRQPNSQQGYNNQRGSSNQRGFNNRDNQRGANSRGQHDRSLEASKTHFTCCGKQGEQSHVQGDLSAEELQWLMMSKPANVWPQELQAHRNALNQSVASSGQQQQQQQNGASPFMGNGGNQPPNPFMNNGGNQPANPFMSNGGNNQPQPNAFGNGANAVNAFGGGQQVNNPFVNPPANNQPTNPFANNNGGQPTAFPSTPVTNNPPNTFATPSNAFPTQAEAFGQSNVLGGGPNASFPSQQPHAGTPNPSNLAQPAGSSNIHASGKRKTVPPDFPFVQGKRLKTPEDELTEFSANVFELGKVPENIMLAIECL